jgi:hypothetical protein
MCSLTDDVVQLQRRSRLGSRYVKKLDDVQI